MKQIQREHPALVLLDIMMPKMDGFEVCKAVKTNPDLHHIRIVMVSAKTDQASRYRAQRLGADDFINKPILPGEILRRTFNPFPLSRLSIDFLFRCPKKGSGLLEYRFVNSFGSI